MPAFSLSTLLRDVFQPAAGERVLVLADVPGTAADWTEDWRERLAMAGEWCEGFAAVGAVPYPLATFEATGAHNTNLPEQVTLGEERRARLDDLLRATDIVVAMTEYSATAPLSGFVRSFAPLRVASMPGVVRRMEETALAADSATVARKTHRGAALLTEAGGAEIEFETGHRLFMDLRHRRGLADDGLCTPDKAFPLINLPSGEAFIVPYEGERAGDPSRTRGEIPVGPAEDRCVFRVEANRIVEVQGDSAAGAGFRALFEEDPARANIAELGLGCNPAAVVSGNVLEDEKVGFHWAYGRSEHLGGVTSPEAFRSPAHVLHVDVVYARGCPIRVTDCTLVLPGGERVRVVDDGETRFPGTS